MYRQLIEEKITIRHNQFHEISPSDVIICCQNSLKTQLIWPIFAPCRRNLFPQQGCILIFWNSPLDIDLGKKIEYL